MARELAENDKLEIVHTGKEVSKDEFEKEFTLQNEEQDAKSIYLDGTYKLVGIRIDKDEATLRSGNKTFSASTKFLSEEHKKDIHERFMDGHLKGFYPDIDLWISSIVENGKLETAEIVNVDNSPREGAMQYKDLSKQTKGSIPKEPFKQKSLLDWFHGPNGKG